MMMARGRGGGGEEELDGGEQEKFAGRRELRHARGKTVGAVLLPGDRIDWKTAEESLPLGFAPSDIKARRTRQPASHVSQKCPLLLIPHFTDQTRHESTYFTNLSCCLPFQTSTGFAFFDSCMYRFHFKFLSSV